MDQGNNSRVKARDARRIRDIHELRTAIENYYLENNRYPFDTAYFDTSRGMGDPSNPPSGNDWQVPGGLADLSPKFISITPKDPLNNYDPQYYYYEPVIGQTQYGATCGSQPCAYIISALLENPSSSLANPGCNQCQPAHNYCVSGGGAQLGAPCF